LTNTKRPSYHTIFNSIDLVLYYYLLYNNQMNDAIMIIIKIYFLTNNTSIKIKAIYIIMIRYIAISHHSDKNIIYNGKGHNMM
jgi:hypothetical protein